VTDLVRSGSPTSVGSHHQHAVVILQEMEGERVLPIWIGPAERAPSRWKLAGVKFSRPLTHDLLKQSS